MDDALEHSNKCRELLAEGQLADAIAYCSAQRVEPPHVQLDVGAPDHVADTLCDYGWWVKRLKMRTVRESEKLRIRQGLSALAH